MLERYGRYHTREYFLTRKKAAALRIQTAAAYHTLIELKERLRKNTNVYTAKSAARLAAIKENETICALLDEIVRELGGVDVTLEQVREAVNNRLSRQNNTKKAVVARKKTQRVHDAASIVNRNFNNNSASAAEMEFTKIQAQATSLYRKIANLLHPDKNNGMNPSPQLLDLFTRAKEAKDLLDIELLEILLLNAEIAKSAEADDGLAGKIDSAVPTEQEMESTRAELRRYQRNIKKLRKDITELGGSPFLMDYEAFEKKFSAEEEAANSRLHATKREIISQRKAKAELVDAVAALIRDRVRKGGMI